MGENLAKYICIINQTVSFGTIYERCKVHISQSHINRWSVCQKCAQRRYNWKRKKLFFLAFIFLAKELKKLAILCGQYERTSVSY